MAKVVSSRFLRAFFLLLLAVSHVLAIMNPRRLPLRSPAPPSIRRGRQRRYMGACPVLCAREQKRSFHWQAVSVSSPVVDSRRGKWWTAGFDRVGRETESFVRGAEQHDDNDSRRWPHKDAGSLGWIPAY